MHFFEEGTENIDPYFILLGHTTIKSCMIIEFDAAHENNYTQSPLLKNGDKWPTLGVS